MVKTLHVGAWSLLVIATTPGCAAIAAIEDLHLKEDDGGGADGAFDDVSTGDTHADTTIGDGGNGDTTIGDGTTVDADASGDGTVIVDGDAGTDSTATTDTTATPDTRDSGTDTGTPDTPDTAPPPCPTGGQPMVRVTTSKTSYCIDVNEVTTAQMVAYTASGFSPPTKPTICSSIPVWNRDGAARDTDPAYNVQWCTAWAYCQSVGKRLCGRLDTTTAATPTNSEFAYACGNGTSPLNLYPYGDGFVMTTCDVGTGRSTPDLVTSHPDCHGRFAPYSSIFNMSGSQAEWTDDCPDAGKCWVRGGYFGDISDNAKCTSYFSLTMSVEQAGNGVRCCK